MIDDDPGCIPVAFGLIVGVVIGCFLGSSYSSSRAIQPDIVITTTNGVSKVAVNGHEIDLARATEIRDAYAKLVAEWPGVKK